MANKLLEDAWTPLLQRIPLTSTYGDRLLLRSAFFAGMVKMAEIFFKHPELFGDDDFTKELVLAYGSTCDELTRLTGEKLRDLYGRKTT